MPLDYDQNMALKKARNYENVAHGMENRRETFGQAERYYNLAVREYRTAGKVSKEVEMKRKVLEMREKIRKSQKRVGLESRID